MNESLLLDPSRSRSTPRRRWRGPRVNLRMFMLLWLMASFLVAWWGIRRQIHAVETRLHHTEEYVSFSGLGGMHVDCDGVVHAAHGDGHDLLDLPNHQHVTEINLHRFEASQLAALDKFPELQTIRFCHSLHGAADEAADRLGRRLRLKRVTVSHAHDADLVPLSRLRRLEFLHLDHSTLTDASIQPLSRMTGLRVLSIHGSQITPAGAARLKQALPRCQLVLGPAH